MPLRHVTALDDLTDAEASALGPLLRSATAALRAVTGCTKSYVVLFAEADGFAHLHFHIVPRTDDQPAHRRGPAIFGYLADAALDDDRRDEVAGRLRQAWR